MRPEMYLILFGVGFAVAALVSFATKTVVGPTIVGAAVTAIGCAVYYRSAVRRATLVNSLIKDDKLTQDEEHIEKYELLTTTLREILEGRGFHPTDEYIADMLNRQHAAMEFVRGLDQANLNLKGEIITVAGAILSAEADGGRVRM